MQEICDTQLPARQGPETLNDLYSDTSANEWTF